VQGLVFIAHPLNIHTFAVGHTFEITKFSSRFPMLPMSVINNTIVLIIRVSLYNKSKRKMCVILVEGTRFGYTHSCKPQVRAEFSDGRLIMSRRFRPASFLFMRLYRHKDACILHHFRVHRFISENIFVEKKTHRSLPKDANSSPQRVVNTLINNK
jgi:hypothetical protein